MIEKLGNDMRERTLTSAERLVYEIVKSKADNVVRLIIKAVNDIGGGATEYNIDLERAKRALIKEFSLARILTLEELRNVHEPMLVWVQDSDKDIAVWPEEFHRIGKVPHSDEESVECSNGFDYVRDYGHTYIFWSAKPTAEQQAEVVWTVQMEEGRE